MLGTIKVKVQSVHPNSSAIEASHSSLKSHGVRHLARMLHG